MSERLLSPDELIATLRADGEARYHDRHPFHQRMHSGALSRTQLQAWVANRFYYQTRIPKKDALILAKSDDPAFRRAWIGRIQDHDGRDGEAGGIELWLTLARGVGLDEAEVVAFTHVLPGTRFACDAYVELVARSTLLEAVASSLTEFFAPDLLSRRIVAWQTHYPWLEESTLAYFRSRVPRARRDSETALAYVLAHARTAAEQQACRRALITKCEILWALLDAVDMATSSGADGAVATHHTPTYSVTGEASEARPTETYSVTDDTVAPLTIVTSP